MVELTFANLGVLGAAFLVGLVWFSVRAIRFQRGADSSRWRGKREIHWMDGGGKSGPNYIPGGFEFQPIGEYEASTEMK